MPHTPGTFRLTGDHDVLYTTARDLQPGDTVVRGTMVRTLTRPDTRPFMLGYFRWRVADATGNEVGTHEFLADGTEFVVLRPVPLVRYLDEVDLLPPMQSDHLRSNSE